MIVPGQTGTLCEPRQPESFIRAIDEFVHAPEHWADFRHEARSFALGRSWEAIFDRLLEDYEQIIDARQL